MSSGGSAEDGAETTESNEDGVVIFNPDAGSGDHEELVRSLATEFGFAVEVSADPGEAVDIASRVARNGAVRIGACGGDGTVNEVVRGIVEADALSTVSFGVIPAGTGNNFSGNLGIEGIEHGFELLAAGPTRRIDLGIGNEMPFVNSCICGLTADASGETSSDLKERFGVLAYAVTTLRMAADNDGGVSLRVRADVDESETRIWSGEAVLVLIGNARRFPARGRTQANVEDGTFDVTIVEHAPPRDILGEAAIQRLVGEDTERTTHVQASEVEVKALGNDPVTFSFDGEMVSCPELVARVAPKALSVFVGETYEPNPEL